MQEYDFVIVGGGIAGTTCAETIRARDKESKIAIISDEPYPFYSRVLLSKPTWVLGKQPFGNVWLKKEEWYTENNIHLFRGISATALDASAHMLTLEDGDVLSYKKLLLATGAHTRKWEVSGSQKEGIYYLRTLDDARKIQELAQGGVKRAVCIGSSCTSFEIAEILLQAGFHVSEVMREPFFFSPSLSKEEIEPLEKVLEEHGVDIYRSAEVVEVLGEEKIEGVRLTDGTVVACDVILPLIGVEFPLAWVREAGIEVRRGILANEYLETNIPDVYTAGDTAEYRDLVLDEMVLMGDWMSARTQGELAGKNMLGERVALEQVTFHASHGFGFYLGWVGDTRLLAGRSAYTVVLSGEKPNQYARLITQDGVVKGGSVVNRPDLVLKITKLIRERKDMHPFLTDNATISEAVFA